MSRLWIQISATEYWYIGSLLIFLSFSKLERFPYQKNIKKMAPSSTSIVCESPSIPGRFEWLFGDQTPFLPSFLLPVQWQLVGDLKWDERSQASQCTCQEVFWRPKQWLTELGRPGFQMESEWVMNGESFLENTKHKRVPTPLLSSWQV